MTLDQCSRLKSFKTSSGFARPYRLIKTLPSPSSTIFDSSALLYSIQLWNVQSQHSLQLIGTLQLHFVQNFQDIVVN